MHIVNPFEHASGGSEWRSIHLQRQLSPHCEAILWTETRPDPLLAERFPIRQIGGNGTHPEGGVVVFVGVWYSVGEWLRQANPRRVIVVYNTVQPDLLVSFYQRLNQLGFFNIEVVFASKLVEANIEGLTGTTEPTLIDTDRFHPRTSRPEGPFTIGRMSRDNWEKHHTTDLTLYRELLKEGCRIRIMGGTCLEQVLTPHPNLELLPVLAEDPADFIRTLDCFYYRTSERWVEAAGRVVAEALSCAVPVVGHRSGGYREWIESGVSGYLFDTKDQALKIIKRLKSDKKLCKSIGVAGRKSMCEMLSREVRMKIVEFYMR